MINDIKETTFFHDVYGEGKLTVYKNIENL